MADQEKKPEGAGRQELYTPLTPQRRLIDADEALVAVQGHGEPWEIDADTNNRLLRSIDWRLMPVRRLNRIVGRPANICIRDIVRRLWSQLPR